MKKGISEIYSLELLSVGDSVIHRLHPMVKLLSTTIYIITIISFGRYSFFSLAPYIFYPVLLMALSETPYTLLLKRFLVVVPFCLFGGITNIIYDRSVMYTIGGKYIPFNNSPYITGGTVSCFTILLKTFLCVMAVFILVSVTPLADISSSMRSLMLPEAVVIVFEMIYRYLGVLFNEIHSVYLAYSLRSPKSKGIALHDIGSFLGQLLLRSFDRAERIYTAMKCRGYPQNRSFKTSHAISLADILFCLFTCFLSIMFRFVDFPTLINTVMGVL